MLPQHQVSRREVCLSAALLGLSAGRVFAQAQGETDPWPSLAAQIFNDRPVGNSNTLLAIDAPYRAEDAAVVPIGLQDVMPAGDSRRISRVTLVIDQNPSPLAATFTLGKNSGIHRISTRVRIDLYTNVHAVSETEDGTLLSAERFVKAAGGCSAPAAKQGVDAFSPGTMRFRQFAAEHNDTSGWANQREAQLMIRHPNYTGMQMDQLTRLYVPAHFIALVKIWQGDDLLLTIESGISISENPEFRFSYQPNGASQFRAEATDSEGKTFAESWPAAHA